MEGAEADPSGLRVCVHGGTQIDEKASRGSEKEDL